MSTPAGARLPLPDKDPAQTGASSDTARVQRLISQLEAASVALVPYDYGVVRQAPPRRTNSVLIGGILVSVWIVTMVVGVAYIRSSADGGAQPGPIQQSAAALTVPVPASPVDVPKAPAVVGYVDHLAKEQDSSVERLKRVEAMLAKFTKEKQRVVAGNKSVERPKIEAEPVRASVVVAAAAAMPMPDQDPPIARPPARQKFDQVLDIQPSQTAVPHKSAMGTIDYWLVPRGNPSEKVKALPIGTNADGVLVYNIDDGREYTLTAAGEWKSAEPSGASK